MVQKVVVVTGSTSGIGHSIAQAFAKDKCQVVINGIEKKEEVANILDEMQQLSGCTPLYSSADLSTAQGCRDLIQETLNQLKRVDILVNNAGIQYVAPMTEFPEDKWEKVLHLNLGAAFYLSQAALPSMYQNKWGRIIHISSAHGFVASPGKAAYVSAKHGLLGLSKVIAVEAAGRGVTSNCICPGYVLTPLVQQQLDALSASKNLSPEETKKVFLAGTHPSGEFVTLDNIAGLALFLGSEQANHVTGAAITVDDGWTAH